MFIIADNQWLNKTNKKYVYDWLWNEVLKMKYGEGYVLVFVFPE